MKTDFCYHVGMSKDRWIVVIVAFISLGIIFYEVKRSVRESPVTDADSVSRSEYAGISSKGLLEKMDQGQDFILIDTRTPAEYNEGHIRGAVNVPVAVIDTAYATLSRDKEIILYCKSGPWSRQAYKILRDKGFNNIRVLANGIVGWKWEVNGEVVASTD